MGRRLILGVVLSLTALVCVPGVAMGRTLVVGSGPGCADGRYSTIQAALDVARPGDQVPVCPGTYPENVSVQTDRVKLYSRKRHAAVIEMPSGTQGPIIGLGGRVVLLRGFTITGLPPTGPCAGDATAVEVFGSGTVDYNRILNLGCDSISTGIDNTFALAPERFTVERNEISVSGIGVDVRGLPTVAVNRNVIRGGETGVAFGDNRFGGAGYGLVQANTIEDASFAGVFANGLEQESFRLLVSGNRLRRNGNGIRIEQVGQGVGSDQFRFTRIERNTVLDSVDDGIAIDSGRGFVYRNRVLGSGGFDCIDPHPAPRARTWKDNIGVTDNPSNLCRAP